MSIADRVRVKDVELLSKRRYELKSATFDYRRSNGEWQTQVREVYDRGNGAVLLPYNLGTRTVVLVRQFRYPAFANGYDDLLIEAAAGMRSEEHTSELQSLAYLVCRLLLEKKKKKKKL